MAVDDKYRSYAHAVEVLRKGEDRGAVLKHIVVQRLRTSDIMETRQVSIQVLRERSDPAPTASNVVMFVVSS